MRRTKNRQLLPRRDVIIREQYWFAMSNIDILCKYVIIFLGQGGLT